MKRRLDTVPVPGHGGGKRRALRDRTPIGIIVLLLAAIGQFASANGSIDHALGAGKAKGGAQYAVDRWTVDGGGGRSSGGSYTLGGTIAQPDSDPLQPSTGGSYAITGGFWPGLDQSAPTPTLFGDGFEPTNGNRGQSTVSSSATQETGL